MPKRKAEKSGDYVQAGILHLENTVNFFVDPNQTSTHDDTEKQLDYWREDPMIHVFHNLFHLVYEHTYPQDRKHERFYYTHSQITRRFALERKLLGMADIIPLETKGMENLGPGYDITYWGFKYLKFLKFN